MNPRSLIWLAALVAGGLLLTAVADAAPVTPLDANEFIHSIGVNTQMGGRSTGYADFARVKANLKTIGIRHIRNPLWGSPIPYGNYNDLAVAGICLLVPTGYNHDGRGVNALVSELHNIVGAVEGVEGVNEPDNFARQTTAQQLLAYQQEIYTKINADPLLKDKWVLALSLGNPYSNNLGQQLVDLNAGIYSDCANSHAYPSAWMPEEHSWVKQMVDWANRIDPGGIQVMTETGYGYGSSDAAAGIYTPRLLLDLYCRRGVKRSYIYQLVDIGDGFGGLYQTDGRTINAQGRSVKNLITVLNLGSNLPATPLTPLDFVLSGNTTSLRSQLFEQHGGAYLLFLWRAYEATNLGTASVTVKLGGFALGGARGFGDLDSASFNAAGTVLPFTDNDQNIPVGGKVVIVRLTPRSSGPTATTTDFALYR